MVQLLHVLGYTALAVVSVAAFAYNDHRTDDGLGEIDRRGIFAVVLGNFLFIFGAQFLLRRWDSFAEFGVGAVVAFAVAGLFYYTRRENSGSVL